MIDVVNASATVNVAQAVGNMDGTVIVPSYDWTTFLAEHIDRCVGIKSFHHLRFSANRKGHVFVQEKSDSEEVDVVLLKDDWSPSATELPELITPSGLTPNRQWYLFNKIREFCPDECQDITCPKPSEPDTTFVDPPSTSFTRLVPSSSATPADPTTLKSPSAKRPRLCGICRETGHNARSCPTKL